MEINYIDGDLITLAKKGTFDVIAHGCNCRCNMGAGIAPQMAKAFGADKFEMEQYIGIEKLGNIDYEIMVLGENAIWSLNDAKNNRNEPELAVVNAYTQNYYGRNPKGYHKKPVDYCAISLCMKKINSIFAGKHVGLPKIGAGLGGGNWDKILGIIREELTDCEVTIVNYKKG